MDELLTAITSGLTAFSATNIDDIVILTLFFSQINPNLRHWHIVAGQYLGFTLLVIASLPGFFGSLIVPEAWVGMLGVIPITIGISRLLNRETDEDNNEPEIKQPENSLWSRFLSPQIYGVAGVTVANGSDNISIYVPLFASNTWESLLIVLSVFFLLVGVWCYTAYRLTCLPAIADTLTRYGNYFVPFVLMGLGVLILVKSHTLESGYLTAITLVASCCFLVPMLLNNQQSPEIENN